MNRRDRAALSACGLTDIGTVRKNNEDRFALVDINDQQVHSAQYHGEINGRGFLLVVSDGAGADGRGEVASELGLHIFLQEIFAKRFGSGTGDCLMQAARTANEMIWEQAHKQRELAGMAATLTAALIVPPLVYVVEVGDSRCYLARGGTIRQLTRDQSMVQMLIDSGVLTPHSARTHPYRNIVLQSLGARATVTPVVTTVELARGDCLLLCSDGLSKYLTDDQLLANLTDEDPARAAQALIDCAKQMESDDNITVVIARVTGEAFAPAAAVGALVLAEAADEAELSEELEDVTDMLTEAEELE